MKHVQKKRRQIGIGVLIRITKAKRQREMPSGCNGEIIFSPQVVSCQPCNQQDSNRDAIRRVGGVKDIETYGLITQKFTFPSYFLRKLFENWLKQS